MGQTNGVVWSAKTHLKPSLVPLGSTNDHQIAPGEVADGDGKAAEIEADYSADIGVRVNTVKRRWQGAAIDRKEAAGHTDEQVGNVRLEAPELGTVVGDPNGIDVFWKEIGVDV